MENKITENIRIECMKLSARKGLSAVLSRRIKGIEFDKENLAVKLRIAENRG